MPALCNRSYRLKTGDTILETSFEQIANDYMLMILNWAYKKTGHRDKAEDLAQETLLQIFTALQKSEAPIADTERFIWKIAHNTWCNYVRGNERRKMCISMENLPLEDEKDFAADYAENEYRRELTQKMRSRISRLNRLQREIIIAFYLESLSIREIALKYGLTEAAVKWHLFSTRKKLKKEITLMENNNYVYRPRTLHMALSGQITSVKLSDILMIENSLTKQNICLACYHSPRTKDTLAELLGIPMAYIEHDLAWLVEREFIEENGSGYSTSFLITDTETEQGEYAVYLKHKKLLSDVIAQELTARQRDIRAIGFHGCDRPFDRLLWLLIYQFCLHLDLPCPAVERPARMDGGRYLPLGFDRDGQADVEKTVDTSGWSYNGSMENDDFYWFGMYNFNPSEIEDMMDACVPEYENLHTLLCELIHSDFRIPEYDEAKKFTLAQLVQKGFVTVADGLALPNFCVFTDSQYRQLRENVFTPIGKKLEAEMQSLTDDLKAYYKRKLPAQLKHLESTAVRHALGDLGFLSTFFAFRDGRLYRPEEKRDGEFLTMMYVRR